MYCVKPSSKGSTPRQAFDSLNKTTLAGAKWRHHKRFDEKWKPLLPRHSTKQRRRAWQGEGRGLFASRFLRPAGYQAVAAPSGGEQEAYP
jgi:hypothetical protein